MSKLWTWLKTLKPPQLSPTLWLVVALSVAVLVLGFLVRREQLARRVAERNVEAEELRAKGLLVAEDAKANILKQDLATLQVEFVDLKAALDDARKKAGAVKLVEVDKFITVPVPVLDAYRDSDGGVVDCVLAAGDEGEIRIAELRLQTKKGNDLAVGVGEAWRVAPGAPMKLFSSAFQASTSVMAANLEAITAAKPPGWGAGPLLTVGKGGWTLGPVIATPVVDLFWGWKLEALGSVGVGSGGNVVGAAGAIIRR